MSVTSHTTTRTLTGASAAMSQVVAEGAEVIFGIPGEHNLHLCNAVIDHPELKFVLGRHEQSVAFMANGYARASGKIAVAIVISGPGVTNALTGLADAYCDSVPMVLLASCPDVRFLGKGAFHELKDQTAALESVTKWNARVEQPEAIPQAIRSAFAQATSGRPGPTAVEISVPVQSQQASIQVVRPSTELSPTADPDAVHEAAQQLNDARLPIVLIGGTARSRCSEDLTWLIEHLDAPCFTTALGKGVVPDDHPLSLGFNLIDHASGRLLLEESTLVLVVGSSLDEVETGCWSEPLPSNLIQIDTCAKIIGRNYPASISLVGDAKSVLGQLRQELSGLERVQRPSPAARIADIKAHVLEKVRNRPAWKFINAIQQALPADAMVTNDASMMNGWALTHLQRSMGQTTFVTRTLAALGAALPMAVGAKVAYPDRQAIALGRVDIQVA